jgi:hypothetical protein
MVCTNRGKFKPMIALVRGILFEASKGTATLEGRPKYGAEAE